MRKSTVGPLLRQWRAQRRCSQMELAHEVGVSPRHLSFVETGRARPSPELVLALAHTLEVPLREQNTLLLAAGYAPRHRATPLGDPQMRRIHATLQRMLDAHDPYPGVVIDRAWNVVLANAAARALVAALPAHVAAPVLNVYRACLHPDGLAAGTQNFDEWARYLLGQLDRTVSSTGDADLVRLRDEVRTYPDVAQLLATPEPSGDDEPDLLVPFRYEQHGVSLSLFTTLTTFGTPRDITLDELAVELFFPADDETEAVLRGGAAQSM